MANDDNQNVAATDLFETGLDWLSGSRTEKFHRVVLKL
jgi:hypothetical protein